MSVLSTALPNASITSIPNQPPVSAWFSGVLAVLVFSLTAPFTSMALEAFTPAFIAFMRASVAGVGSIMVVLWMKWPLPKAKDIAWLILGGAGIALIFPYTLAEALQVWKASDMGVVLAGIPLFTALIAAGLFGEKPSIKFWLSLLVGTEVLILFAYKQSGGVLSSTLFIMLAAAGLGYAIGGHVAKRIGGFQTICWMMVLYFPISVFGLAFNASENAQAFTVENMNAIWALLYLAVMSQWIGFQCWYGAMAQIGIAKTGQLQLLQPFMTLLFTVPLLGSTLTFEHFLFAGFITLSVWWARKSK